MKTTKRFDRAVEKLYNAFHNGYLHPECCKHCAVGNILDNTDAWKHLSDSHGSLELNYVGKVNEGFGKKFNGYSPSELLKIEVAFLKGCGYSLPLRNSSRPESLQSDDVLFSGLCASVSKLCELDNIPDVLDYSILFDYQPKTLIVETISS